jgi:TatD DNase family protein
MVKIFDSHVHLADDLLFPNWEKILQRALDGGVDKFLVIATNPVEMERGLVMKQRYPDHVYLSASITPHEAHTVTKEDVDAIFHSAREGHLDALGETGLEYFYLKETKEAQLDLLEKTLSLAKEFDLPVVFHCREAFEDLFPLLKKYQPRGVLHCFTGTKEEAKGVIDHGLYLSFSGILTYKKSGSLRDIAPNLPFDKILIETDAPFLAPQSKRGKQNEPLFIQETLSVLSDTLQKDQNLVAEQTYDNALQFLNIPKG